MDIIEHLLDKKCLLLTEYEDQYYIDESKDYDVKLKELTGYQDYSSKIVDCIYTIGDEDFSLVEIDGVIHKVTDCNLYSFLIEKQIYYTECSHNLPTLCDNLNILHDIVDESREKIKDIFELVDLDYCPISSSNSDFEQLQESIWFDAENCILCNLKRELYYLEPRKDL